MKQKMTKREWFTVIGALVDTHEKASDELKAGAKAFIAHEVELLDRKRNTKGVDTAKAVEQALVMGTIADVLDAAGEPMRATDIAKGADVSVQKASALLRKMVLNGAVERIEKGKVTTFTLI